MAIIVAQILTNIVLIICIGKNKREAPSMTCSQRGVLKLMAINLFFWMHLAAYDNIDRVLKNIR